MQHQLNEISEQISNLSSLVFSIEQGQYDDRFSGFLSSRQTLIEGLISSDTQTRKTLILSSIVNNNETIGKLMFSLRREANLFINPNVSTEQANESEHFLNESFWYLNQTIQLNLIAYVALGEIRPLTASLNNYKAFIEQVLLTSDKNGKTLSWHIDNTHVGNQGKLGLTARYITTQIDGLVKKTNYKQLEGGVTLTHKNTETCKWPECKKEIANSTLMFCGEHERKFREIEKKGLAITGVLAIAISTIASIKGESNS